MDVSSPCSQEVAPDAPEMEGEGGPFGAGEPQVVALEELQQEDEHLIPSELVADAHAVAAPEAVKDRGLDRR